ncbi:MAG: hypothetical protein M1812_001898 [Candelaria pacifica]|nr:MAG: hypothetical protein M1812_001898 [Candelaria pacifica]
MISHYFIVEDFYHPPLKYQLSTSGTSEVSETNGKHPVCCSESSDRISQLPPEIQDEIFSSLRPAALEAARAVCVGWRNRISSSRWILRKVLLESVPKSRPGDDASEELWHLKKQLRVAAGLHDNTWKARYTRNSVHFIYTEQSQVGENNRQATPPTLGACPASVACLPFGNLLAFITCSDSRYTLMLFCIFRSGQPVFVAAASCPLERGAPSKIEIREVTEERRLSYKVELTFPVYDIMSRSQSTVLEKKKEHKAPDNVGSLLLIQRPAFGKEQTPVLPSGSLVFGSAQPEVGDDPIGVKPTDIMDDEVEQIPKFHSVVGERLPAVSSLWRVLETFTGVMDSSNTWRYYSAYFLAKHEPTGQLFIIRISGPPRNNFGKEPLAHDDNPDLSQGSVTPLVLLSRPYPDCKLRNLAIAPKVQVAHHPELLTRRVAIIWQNSGSHLPLLFFYDIPLLVADCAYDKSQRRKADNIIWPEPSKQHPPNESVYPQQPDPESSSGEFAVPTSYGKRISSLRPGLGGLHWSVEEGSSAAFRNKGHKLDEQASLGGLMLSEDVHQQCMVWGPSTLSDNAPVGLQVLSFNFARDFFYHNYMYWHQASDRGHHHFAGGLLGICACPLHDQVFHVTLPKQVASKQCVPSLSGLTRYSSWLPRAESSPDNGASSNVSITLMETPEQIQARERYERESRAMNKQLENENNEIAKRRPDQFRFSISLNNPTVSKFPWRRTWG